MSETIQQRMQERLQEMLRSCDISAQVQSCAERCCDKAVKLAQTEAQTETKEELRKLKEEFTKITSDSEAKVEESMKVLTVLRVRVDTTTASNSSLATEVSRLDAEQANFQKQEASVRDSLEQGLAAVRRGTEQQKAQFSEVYDRIIPSLRDFHSTLTEEKQSRSEEGQRLQQRLQEFESRIDEHSATQRRTEATGRGFGETLQACHVAVTTVDKRLESLEEAMEERLHDLVHNEVMTGVISHVEDHQRGHLQLLEGKMDKIVRNLHMPAPRTGSRAALSAPVGGDCIEDREQWRQRFRSSLGDSLYVKNALHNGARSASTGSLHNNQRGRRR